MLNILNKNQRLNTIATIMVLIIFLSVAIFYNFSVAKRAEALFGGGGLGNIFSGVFKGVKKAILTIVSEVIELTIDFIMDNKELLMAAAISMKWWTGSNEPMNEILATVRSVAMQTMLSLITMDIITEIQGGEPKYINDWNKFFEDTVNIAGGVWVNEYLGMGYFCEKWDVDIKIALLDEYEFKDVECTLEDMVGNVDDFLESFSAGGWTGFLELVKPQNNPYGTILIAQGEKKKVEEAAKEAGKAEALAGQGFLGRKCTADDVSAGKCTTVGEIITPGSVVSGMATNILNKPIDFLTGLTEDIVNRIPQEYQPYANAVITAFLNQMLKNAMASILGHQSTIDYEAAVEDTFAESITPEMVEVEIAKAKAVLAALNNVKTPLDEIIGVLVEINNKETDILDSSLYDLLIDKPYLPLPSWETYSIIFDSPKNLNNAEISSSTVTIGPTVYSDATLTFADITGITVSGTSISNGAITNALLEIGTTTSQWISSGAISAGNIFNGIITFYQDATLTATGVGSVDFTKDTIQTINSGSISSSETITDIIFPEITSEQSLYNPIDTSWNTANTEYDQFLDSLEILQTDPSNESLIVAAANEETEALAAVNDFLILWTLSSSDNIESISKLVQIELILADKLGESTYDPNSIASDYEEPFLSSYYYKYYYDLVPKVEELDNIVNPPGPPPVEAP